MSELPDKLKLGIKKTCAICGERKPLSEFYKNRVAPSGLGSYCKTCERPYRKQLRKDHK